MKKPTKAKKKRDAYGNVRLNLRMHPLLEAFLRDYAARRHTTVTQIITDHINKLKEQDEYERVDQI